MDHDQRFKTLIRVFFAEFMFLFFAKWAHRFDLDKVEWLDKEVLPDPPDGNRHVLDMVAKLRAIKPGAAYKLNVPEMCLGLVHIEIESPDRTTNIEPRLPSYYTHLRDQTQLTVLPIVIYLKVGLDGIGIRVFDDPCWDDFAPLTFRYLYVGLPGLDAVEYVEGDNWLGVALSALMAIPKDRIAWLGAEALRRLADAPLTDQKRFLLSECVNAYLPLDAESKKTFEQITMGEQYAKVRAMNKTVYEQGIEKGIERSHFEMAEAVLTKRFGPLSEITLDRLRGFPPARLRELILDASAAKTLKELDLAD